MHPRCFVAHTVRAPLPHCASLRHASQPRGNSRRRQLRKLARLRHAAFFTALALPATGHGQQAAPQQLAPVQVQGSAYKAEQPQSPKYRKPLRDTPQSITIVPETVLREQGAQQLNQVLANVPGITFSSGEGGLGWGDMFTLRGFPAEQGITIDGVRDTALNTRGDIFNLEQLEVFKGTGSVEAGVGAPGGTVNLVTKSPLPHTIREVNGALGTDKYRRATLDLNEPLGKHAAIRLNAMRHHNAVAGRGPVEFDRWGIAPSLALGLGGPTTLVLSHFHQQDTNIPDFGLPISRNSGKRMRWVRRDHWAGLEGVDTEQTRKSSTTLRLDHRFNDALAVRNQTRWSETRRFTLQNTGGRPLNAYGAASTGVQDIAVGYSDYWGYDRRGDETYPTGRLATQRLNNYANAYRGRIVANQTDFMIDFDAAGMHHAAVVGVEHYEDSYLRLPDNRLVPPYGQRWVYDVGNPDMHYNGGYVPAGLANRSGARIHNWAAYFHDHVTLTPQWEVAGGLRADRFKASWYDRAGERLPFSQRHILWSGRLALIYKPTTHASIYVSYAQATQPSAAEAATKRGERADPNIPHYSPGTSHNWELGGKWDVLDQRLALTGAIFQSERANPTDVNPVRPDERVQLAATHRVRGIELGAAGSLTPVWSVFSGLALMDGGRVIKDAEHPVQEGGRLQNVPRITFNLWTSYRLAPQWTVSAGGQYVGERRYASGNEVARGRYKGHSIHASAPAYWIANAALQYQPSKAVTLRLNINNVFDHFYIERVSASYDRFQHYGVPGAGRTIVLSTEFQL
ncbi:TonB-dependent siderophore receptor [Pusillimonas sp. TS35]|uniref:TonB-dependent receptor n=1 Tax=Paracandidimonas lactea TaxID=2895524 RepID=UPI00136F28B3|nr:TonB-dependent siderophore receptor [Paracandidimonas lactea]MYN11729.1 TonB-dependent siderophore receptor [Pusillimonas sp. TS35]